MHIRQNLHLQLLSVRKHFDLLPKYNTHTEIKIHHQSLRIIFGIKKDTDTRKLPTVKHKTKNKQKLF